MQRGPQLNHDVCLRVLSHLDAEDIAHVSATCRFWRDAASHPQLWQRFLTKPLAFAGTRPATCPGRSPLSHFRVNCAWTAAAATERRVGTPLPPAIVAVSAGEGDGYTVAVAAGADYRPRVDTWRTPLTFYRPSANCLRPSLFASLQHYVGAQPVCLKIHACSSSATFMVVYAYSDGVVALYSVPVAPGGGALVEATLVWRSLALLGESVTAVDVNECQVLVGTMAGAVVVLTTGGDATRCQLVQGGQVSAVCASRDLGAGLAGSSNGEVFAFDMTRRGDRALTRYVGPSGHPVGALAYGASGGLVIATYYQTTLHSLPPVATAWDSHTGRRIGSFSATRMRRRRISARRGVAVGAPDSTGSDSKIGVLVGGAVLVYDVRRITGAVAEVGDDAVSVAMAGDRVVVGESVGDVHGVRCLDFGAAARLPSLDVSRFPPLPVGPDSPWRARPRVALAPPGTARLHGPCSCEVQM